MMEKRQRLEIPELVQEIEMLIDDWHFTKCPHDEAGPKYTLCKDCPNIKVQLYDSNGELRK